MLQVEDAVRNIDQNIDSQTGIIFGIKVSAKLFRELKAINRVTIEKLGKPKTDGRPNERARYNKKYVVTKDPALKNYEFILDVPGDVVAKSVETMEQELQNQPNPNFGLIMGKKLYVYLCSKGKIKNIPISGAGTDSIRLFLPTFKGNFPVVIDSETDDFGWRIGISTFNINQLLLL